MTLAPEGISEIDSTGVTSESGVREEFDVIVLATGFEVSDFLGPLKITGKNGIDLHEQWNERVGAQAYFGMHVHNFPNFAMMQVKSQISDGISTDKPQVRPQYVPGSQFGHLFIRSTS